MQSPVFPLSTVKFGVKGGITHFRNIVILTDKVISLPTDQARPNPSSSINMAFKMLSSVVQRAEETIATLFSFITVQGSSDCLGEHVSQLKHSLQAAHLACEAGADEETILGALLHDVGRFIPQSRDMPKMIAPGGTFIGRASHKVLGEKYLRELGFSEKIASWLALMS